MAPSQAVVEQQAKLGVSAEESKAERLKRQQARFRDRGGTFVPTDSNPLIDILLARTVSGESPSKARPNHVATKHPLPSKTHQGSPMRRASTGIAIDGVQVGDGGSKSKAPASRKRNNKTAKLEADTTTKPAPKQRGRPAKGKKKAPDPDSDAGQPSHSTKPKTTLKGKGKQSGTGRNQKSTAKSKTHTAKAVVEVLVSDDDRTLVEVPRKSKSNTKRSVQYDDDSDDDAPIVRKQVKSPLDDPQASGTKTASLVKVGKVAGMKSLGKTLHETTIQNDKPQQTSKKRSVPPDDADVAAPVTKKGKTADSMPKSKTIVKPVPTSRTTKGVKNGDTSKATGDRKGKNKVGLAQDITESGADNDNERPPERTSKPKKRKKDEDGHDDRPRKAVKFSDIGLPHSSSHKLKENQSDKKQMSVARSRVKDESDILLPKPIAKPPSRIKKSKGPPREVLERIKASAAQHLQCADSEPDELDCLS